VTENTPDDPAVKVLVVDDHALLREGVAGVLRGAGYAVFEAGSGDRAVEIAAAVRPQLVIMDVLMPGMSGIEAVERIIDRDPAARVLMLSMADSAETVRAAVKAGAAGYLTKDVASRDTLLDALRRTAAGERVFAPAELIDALVREPAGLPPSDAARLTLREREVVALAAQGAPSAEIAGSLALSTRTVENHLARIFKKLGITSRAQLARAALEQQADRYPWTGQNCTIMFTDIVAYTAPARSDHDRADLRTAHFEILHDAFMQADIPWSASLHEDRGDGLLIILPPGVPTKALTDRVLPALSAGLRRYNTLTDASRSMRLRTALEFGPVTRDPMGVSGAAIIRAARLLDAPEFKKALHASDADLGAILSDFVYQETTRQDRPGLNPDDLHSLDIRVKETQTTAWIWLSRHATTGSHPATPEAVHEPIRSPEQ
jgi:DNA-binding NarL/FixJ family response regulator